ncbi:MAG TPA: IclR family transcriptional regulator [Gryllotalpicola sp.]
METPPPRARDSASLDDTPTSTTERVARVLLAFAGASSPLGVTEIARRVGLSKAVVHRLLQTLVSTEFVSYSAATRRYTIGPAALSLGQRASAQSELRTVGLPIIARLADDSGESTTLSARVGHRRVYIGQVESSQPIRITIVPGQQVSLAVGSSSMCILAHLTERDVDIVLSRPIPPATERTAVDPALIRRRLAQVREQGFAVTEGERVPESIGIAAPIFDAFDEVAGALSIACLASRTDERRLAELIPLVTQAAADISRDLRQLQAGRPHLG